MLNFLLMQCVVAPNGLIAHMYGPIEGRHHDAFMLGASGLLQTRQQLDEENGQPYVIYGNPVYGVNRYVLASFHGAHAAIAART